jgi:hypothetical protein
MEPKEFDFAKLSLAESTNGLLANPAMTCPTDRSFSSGLVTTDSVGNVSLTDGSKESALLTAGFIVSAMLVGGPAKEGRLRMTVRGAGTGVRLLVVTFL